MTEEKLRALGDYENAAVFTDEERAVLRYADALTATPVEVSDEIYDALKSYYDEKGIMVLTSALAWENYRARFDHALGLESEGFSEGAFCPLPATHGSRREHT